MMDSVGAGTHTSPFAGSQVMLAPSVACMLAPSFVHWVAQESAFGVARHILPKCHHLTAKSLTRRRVSAQLNSNSKRSCQVLRCSWLRQAGFLRRYGSSPSATRGKRSKDPLSRAPPRPSYVYLMLHGDLT